jgi:hypothetical protein
MAEVDGAGHAAHIRLPRIRPRLAAAAVRHHRAKLPALPGIPERQRGATWPVDQRKLRLDTPVGIFKIIYKITICDIGNEQGRPLRWPAREAIYVPRLCLSPLAPFRAPVIYCWRGADSRRGLWAAAMALEKTQAFCEKPVCEN